MFQINDTMTVIFAGLNMDPYIILTYDWTTLKWTRQPSRLLSNRAGSTCSLLKGSDGKTVVAVAAGRSPGKVKAR